MRKDTLGLRFYSYHWQVHFVHLACAFPFHLTCPYHRLFSHVGRVKIPKRICQRNLNKNGNLQRSASGLSIDLHICRYQTMIQLSDRVIHIRALIQQHAVENLMRNGVCRCPLAASYPETARLTLESDDDLFRRGDEPVGSHKFGLQWSIIEKAAATVESY